MNNIKTVTKLNKKELPLNNVVLCSYLMELTDGKIWTVPLDEKNSDYQNILKWVADGNTIQEAD